MEVVFFDDIKIPLPKDKIYARLGYARAKTNLSDKQEEGINKYILEAMDLITLSGAGMRAPVLEISAGDIVLPAENRIKSGSLINFLAGCDELLFMGVTAGKKIVDVIAENSSDKDVTAAVIFDAVASEVVDGALGWIMAYFRSLIRRENRYLTERRFSAGYGDFSLDNQKIMCDILKMDKLGVSLSKEFILVPEKSVTAVAGIGKASG